MRSDTRLNVLLSIARASTLLRPLLSTHFLQRELNSLPPSCLIIHQNTDDLVILPLHAIYPKKSHTYSSKSPIMVAIRALAPADAMSTRRITSGMVGKNNTFTASQVSQLKKHITISKGSKKTPIIRIPAVKVVKGQQEGLDRQNLPLAHHQDSFIKADKKA